MRPAESLRLEDARTREQCAAMSRIHALGWRDTYPGYVPDDYLRTVITDDHWTEQFYRDFTAGDDHGLLLREGDVPLGCIRFGPARDQATYPGWGEILSFYVHPDFRSRGVGGLLMDEALRRLKESGFSQAYVLVLRENEAARRFYAAHGFRWDGTHVDIPFPPDAVCVDLRYTQTL